ncbi:hypothetical protein VNO80_15625 [Phaseolus coccineus]|uniref:Uncharacterized protein n=1 Tax=Phaseolus coccineus TaxID=3886 RepID=A0AAN9MK66_PHACN
MCLYESRFGWVSYTLTMSSRSRFEILSFTTISVDPKEDFVHRRCHANYVDIPKANVGLENLVMGEKEEEVVLNNADANSFTVSENSIVAKFEAEQEVVKNSWVNMAHEAENSSSEFEEELKVQTSRKPGWQA